MPQVVSARSVLHNIVEKAKDHYYASWTNDVNEGNACFAQPNQREVSQSSTDTNAK